jgi:hypothetical protein
MLILKDTDSLLTIITSSGSDIDVCASFVDFDTPDTFTADSTNTVILTATTTTVVGSPTGAKKRNVTGLTCRNIDGSTANTLTINNSDGTTVVTLYKVTLAAGEWLLINEAGVLFVYDTNGGVKVGATAASDTVAGLIGLALQADQEAGTSLLLAVTPGRQHFHPSAAKAWIRATVAGAAPSNTASYNITSVGDTATGDMLITIATDFSGAAVYCVMTASEGINQTGAEANRRNINIKSGSLAAATVSLECWDTATITSALKDPLSWHCAMFGDL